MNISYIRFFQPVTVAKDARGNNDTTTWLAEKDHTMVLEGNYIRVNPKGGGPVTMITIFNTSFFRVSDEPVNTETTTSSKTAHKAKTKQD